MVREDTARRGPAVFSSLLPLPMVSSLLHRSFLLMRYRKRPLLSSCRAWPLGQVVFGGGEPKVARALALFPFLAGGNTSDGVALRALFDDRDALLAHGLTVADIPERADVLLVSGPIVKEVVPVLTSLYGAMRFPKAVLAVGESAWNGGDFHNSAVVVPSLADVVPVAFRIPGAQLTRDDILAALVELYARRGAARAGRSGKVYSMAL